MIPVINDLAARAQRLPPRTKQFLTVVVSRLERTDRPDREWQKYEYDSRVLAEEVREACDTTVEEVKTHCQILEKYKIGELEVDELEPDQTRIRLFASGDDWFFWESIREFCSLKGIPVRAFTEELRFDLLD